MVEINGDEKKFTVVKETITRETFEVLTYSKEEAERMVASGNTIGLPIWKKGTNIESKVIEVKETIEPVKKIETRLTF